jgi:hypothetical protein
MSIALLGNLVVFTLLLVWLARRQAGGVTLSSNVMVSLVLGVALGVALQWGYGHGHAVVDATMTWVDLVGRGYVRLLQMIVIPLVLVSILSAVTRLDDARSLGLRKDNPELGQRVFEGIDAVQGLVMRLVRIVIRLTPYGVLALMTRVVATSNFADILGLIGFVAASYVGLALILGMHAGLLTVTGLSPARFFKKVWPVLTFAFTSRSSAAAIPLNIESQIEKLGVSPAVANFSASFGATIGQNGCAGLYPAMLAVMIAPSVGIDPFAMGFLLPLVLVVTVSSFGIAGVGGGATFAALIVLSTMGLPVALAGLLISIEPLIDMGRTAINVSGSMTAGAVTSRILGETDLDVFQDRPQGASRPSPAVVPAPVPSLAGPG